MLDKACRCFCLALCNVLEKLELVTDSKVSQNPGISKYYIGNLKIWKLEPMFLHGK